MRLKKLTIKNIASISSGEIDFEKSPLSDASIFLICGETGSGKTTILDSICLALYDKTPRLSNKKASDETSFDDNGQEIDIKHVVQLLKKGTDSGSISLTFVGVDGNDYRADWSCRIKPKLHTLDKESWTITDQFGNQRKGSEELMKEITGMDFEQFCRTSMLAQGEFTAFLKAPNSKKSEILEKITGTEIYAKIGERIHAKHLQADKDLASAKSAVGAIVPLPQAEVDKLKAELAGIKASIAKNNDAINHLKVLIDAYETIETDEHDIEVDSQTRERLKAEFRRLCATLAFDKERLEKMNAEKTELDESLSEREPYAAMYQEAQTIIAELRNATTQERIVEAKKEHKKKVEERLKGLVADQEKLGKDLQLATSELAQKQSVLEQAKEAKAAMQPEEVEKERKSIAAEKSAVAEANVELARMGVDVERLAEERTLAKAKEEEIESDRLALKSLTDTAKTAKDKFDAADGMYQMQKECTEKFVTDLRERLRELGANECPVCHSHISMLPTQEEEENNLRPVREEWQRMKSEWEQAEDKRHKAEVAIVIKQGEEQKAKENISVLEARISKVREDFTRKFASLIGPGADDFAEALAEAEAKLSQRSEANEAAIIKIKAQDKRIEEADEAVKKYEKDTVKPAKKAVEDNEKAIIAAKGEVAADEQGIEDAQKAAKDSLGNAGAKILFPEWEKTWNDDREAFCKRLKGDADTYFAEMAKRKDKESEIKTLEKSIADADSRFKSILTENVDFEAKDVVPEQYDGNLAASWGALQASVQNCNERISAAKQDLAKQKAILDGAAETSGDNPEDKGVLIARRAALEESNATLNNQMGACEQKLKDNDELEAQKSNLIADMEAKEAVSKQWTSLNKLFGGEKGVEFRTIAQSYIMQDILDHANGYLCRIAPRYRLFAQPGSLIILVHDMEGDITRSGNTLSGGEGFVVSLSLALGLSSLEESGINTDTIFIDEGFGTLSQDWLDSVMNTLEKLNTTSGKHIGIITHMEDLQSRISTFIEVRRVDAASSTLVVHPSM